MVNEQKLRETIIWLAGLLSTDGSVEKRMNHVSYIISSAEREWLEQIAEKLLQVGIQTTIKSTKVKGRVSYRITLLGPYRVTIFLRKYAKGFMMKRKWDAVLSAYPDGKKKTLWTSEEDKFLLQNYKTMSYAEIGRYLKRRGVDGRVHRLKQRGLIPNEDFRPIKGEMYAQNRRQSTYQTLSPPKTV